MPAQQKGTTAIDTLASVRLATVPGSADFAQALMDTIAQEMGKANARRRTTSAKNREQLYAFAALATGKTARWPSSDC